MTDAKRLRSVYNCSNFDTLSQCDLAFVLTGIRYHVQCIWYIEMLIKQNVCNGPFSSK